MPNPLGMEDLVARELNRLLDRLGPAAAARMGPPRDSEKVSEREELDLWNLADQSVDVGEARAQGLSPSAITRLRYPWRERLIKSGGRTKLKDQLQYAEQMTEKAAKRREAEPPPMPEAEPAAWELGA